MIKQWLGYVICDMDGCLSDDRWRRHLLPKEKPEKAAAYLAYHRLCGSDAIVDKVVDDVLYDIFDEEGKQRSLLIIVTARPDTEDFRARTAKWLDNALNTLDDAYTLIAPRYELLMRPADSLLPAPVIKLHLLNAYFTAQHSDPIVGWQRVVSAYDDRQDVLDAYPIMHRSRQLRVLPEEAQCATHS